MRTKLDEQTYIIRLIKVEKVMQSFCLLNVRVDTPLELHRPEIRMPNIVHAVVFHRLHCLHQMILETRVHQVGASSTMQPLFPGYIKKTAAEISTFFQSSILEPFRSRQELL